MKKYEHIGKGTEITTMEGKIVADSYNGSIVYFDEFLYNEETEEDDIPNGTRMLTLYEAGKIMKESDGRNHNVTWEE